MSKFVFADRESAYPNRYLVTKENGTSEYVVLERADEPVVVGTPLNADTFNAMSDDLYANAGVARPEKATVGQYIRVKAVDENGEITETETADAVENIPVKDIAWVKSDNELVGTFTLTDDTTEVHRIGMTGNLPTSITVGGTTIPLSWEGFE